MAHNHLLRVGAMGHVGPFAALDAVRYPRGSSVVVRTARGLEIGQILAPPDETTHELASEGQILRGMTPEDHLLQARLEKNRQAAYDACVQLLHDRQLDAALVDVEQLFDGQNLFFYFLGEVDPGVAALTDELAETYEAQVQLRKFTETLIEGCGPGCGTEKSGGNCEGCTSCAVASACAPRKK